MPDSERYKILRPFVRDSRMFLELALEGALSRVSNILGPATIPTNSLIRYATGRRAYLTLLTNENLFWDASIGLAQRLDYRLDQILGRPPWHLMTPESVALAKATILRYPDPADDNIRVFKHNSGALVPLEKIASFSLSGQEIPGRFRAMMVVWREVI